MLEASCRPGTDEIGDPLEAGDVVGRALAGHGELDLGGDRYPQPDLGPGPARHRPVDVLLA